MWSVEIMDGWEIFYSSLILYRRITDFEYHGEEAFWKHCIFALFPPHVFSTMIDNFTLSVCCYAFNPLPNNPGFNNTWKKAFENIVGKGANTLVTEILSIFQQRFLLFHEKILPFRPSLTLWQATNFRLFQTERVSRWQLEIWQKWQKVLLMGTKRRGDKEKLLVMSNFSFSHCVFKRLVLQTRKNQGLFGIGLTLSKTTNFRLFQTERICRWQFYENGRKFSKRVEKAVEELLVFPQKDLTVDT